MGQSQNYVINLSKHKINRYEYSALSKGLKFIPTPHKKNLKKVILNDFEMSLPENSDASITMTKEITPE